MERNRHLRASVRARVSTIPSGVYRSLPERQLALYGLAGIAEDEREVLAQMLAEAFQSGVFIALRVLHHQVPPFEGGYQGTISTPSASPALRR